MTTFTKTLQNRRSIYDLGHNVTLSNEELTALIKEAIKESPTAFNAQSTRAVILFGDAHEKLWEMTEEALRPLTPAEAFPNTQNKLAGFKKAMEQSCSLKIQISSKISRTIYIIC